MQVEACLLERHESRQKQLEGIFLLFGVLRSAVFSLPCFTEPASPSTRDGRERNIKCVEALSHETYIKEH